MNTFFISHSEIFQQYSFDKDINEFILEQLSLLPWDDIFTEEQLKYLDQEVLKMLKSKSEESDNDI